jgi:3-oxoacyl-[acyl-carrier-protein] synthase II
MSEPASPEIWITGAAAMTSLADTLDATWEAMLAGRTAGRWVELLTHNCQAIRVPAAAVDNELLKGIPLESSSERADRMALSAARQAATSACLAGDQLASAAIVFGSSKPSVGSWFLRAVLGHQPAEGSPLIPDPLPPDPGTAAWNMLTPQRGAVLVAEALTAEGPVLSSATACSTGLHSIVRAVQWIFDGCGPIAVAGAVDSSLNPLFAASFLRMRVLAIAHEDASRGCRPFDRERAGFVMGEGAGALVLETAEHARARGGRPLAVIAGYSIGADPTGLAELDPAGKPMASTIRRCLVKAGVQPDQVACIKAHGTATFLNDEAEAAAIASVFGDQPPPVISLKGYLGHTIGASGAIETAIVAKSIATGVVPGCANLMWPDPACGPNHPLQPTRICDGSARHVLCLSAGFGGHLAAVLIRKP